MLLQDLTPIHSLEQAYNYHMKLQKADKVDDISNTSLFICSLCIFTGLIMLARLLGNYFVATGADWTFGIIGAGLVLIAFNLPLARLRNSINACPEQKNTILIRFVFISLFLFSLVTGLNAWAWSRDHSRTNVSASISTPGSYSHSTRSAKESDIVMLRMLMAVLTYGASVLYFALLYQPHERRSSGRKQKAGGEKGL